MFNKNDLYYNYASTNLILSTSLISTSKTGKYSYYEVKMKGYQATAGTKPTDSAIHIQLTLQQSKVFELNRIAKESMVKPLLER